MAHNKDASVAGDGSATLGHTANDEVAPPTPSQWDDDAYGIKCKRGAELTPQPLLGNDSEEHRGVAGTAGPTAAIPAPGLPASLYPPSHGEKSRLPIVSAWGGDRVRDESHPATTVITPPSQPKTFQPTSFPPSRGVLSHAAASTAWGDEDEGESVMRPGSASPSQYDGHSLQTSLSTSGESGEKDSKIATLVGGIAKAVETAASPSLFPPSRVGHIIPPAAFTWGDDSDTESAALPIAAQSPLPSGEPHRQPLTHSPRGDLASSLNDGGFRGGMPLPFISNTPNSIESKRIDMNEAGGEGLPHDSPTLPKAPAVDTTWGSDDDDDDSTRRASLPWSRPFQLGAAVGNTFTGTERHRRIPAPTPRVDSPIAHAYASRGRGEEEANGSDSSCASPLSRPFRMGAAAAVGAQPLDGSVCRPPSTTRRAGGRYGNEGEGGDDSEDEDVTIPLPSPVPYTARAESKQVISTWADEDGDYGDDSIDGVRSSNTNQGWGSGSRTRDWLYSALVSTLPRRHSRPESSPADVQRPSRAFASTYPGQSVTPLTATPSPWPNAHESVSSDEDDPLWGFGSTETPRGRWLNSQSTSTVLSRRMRGLDTEERSPLHVGHGSPHISRIEDQSTMNHVPMVPRSSTSYSPFGSWLRQLRLSIRSPGGGLMREGGAPRPDNGDGNEEDKGQGVRAWTWWDNLKTTPGLLARLCACTLAVCALWATTLSVTGDGTFHMSKRVRRKSHPAVYGITGLPRV